jgi:hypothetical protein
MNRWVVDGEYAIVLALMFVMVVYLSVAAAMAQGQLKSQLSPLVRLLTRLERSSSRGLRRARSGSSSPSGTSASTTPTATSSSRSRPAATVFLALIVFWQLGPCVALSPWVSNSPEVKLACVAFLVTEALWFAYLRRYRIQHEP